MATLSLLLFIMFTIKQSLAAPTQESTNGPFLKLVTQWLCPQPRDVVENLMDSKFPQSHQWDKQVWEDLVVAQHQRDHFQSMSSAYYELLGMTHLSLDDASIKLYKTEEELDGLRHQNQEQTSYCQSQIDDLQEQVEKLHYEKSKLVEEAQKLRRSISPFLSDVPVWVMTLGLLATVHSLFVLLRAIFRHLQSPLEAEVALLTAKLEEYKTSSSSTFARAKIVALLLSVKISQQSKRIAALVQEIMENREKQNKQATEEREKLESEKEGLISALNEKTEALEGLENKFKLQESQGEKAKKEIERILSEVTSLTEEKNKASEESRRLEEVIASLTQEKNELSLRVTLLTGEKDKMRRGFDETKSKLEGEKAESQRQLENETKRLEGEKKEAQEQFKAEKRRCETEIKKRLEEEKEFEFEKRKFETEMKQSVNFETEKKRLEAEKAQLSTKLEEKDSELERVRGQMNTKVKQLNEIILRKTGEINILKSNQPSHKEEEVKKLNYAVEVSESAKVTVEKLYESEVAKFASALIKERLVAKKLEEARAAIAITSTKPKSSPNKNFTELETQEKINVIDELMSRPDLTTKEKDALIWEKNSELSKKQLRETRRYESGSSKKSFVSRQWATKKEQQ